VAIAFRAAGAATKVSITSTPGITVANPAGMVSGDLQIMVVEQDSRTFSTPGSTPGAAWVLAGRQHTTSTQSSPTLEVYTRICNGSEGASSNWTFSTATWPTGQPYVNAFSLAYSGCATTSPVELVAFLSDAAAPPHLPANSQNHPQVTSAAANDWLISIRCWGATTGDTLTTSLTAGTGTDVERVDSFFMSLACGYYDSNAALAAGLQPQVTTLSSENITTGTIEFSMLIRPAAAPVQAGMASGTGTAFTPSVVAVTKPWDMCDPSQTPTYQWAIDWANTGLTAPGRVLNDAPYVYTDLTGWTNNNYAIAFSAAVLQGRSVPMIKVTPDGVNASGGVNALDRTVVGSIVPGNTYIAQTWIYSPAGWADFRPAVDWVNAGGGFISSSASPAIAVAAGQWTLLEQSLVAPALASRAVARARQGSSPAVTDVWYAFGIVLMDPTLSESRMVPGPMDLVTWTGYQDILDAGATWSYGRDQTRQINPAAVGTAGFSVINANRMYSPENPSSPLYGNLDAARQMSGQVLFGGAVYPLVPGRVDDFNVNVDRDNRTVDFTFQDPSAAFATTPVSTAAYNGIRTGAAISAVLDAVGWTGQRDIDLGSTIMPWWWLSNTAAGNAINDLVLSEGTPAIAYVAPDGTFTFRDRHHRLVRQASVFSQAKFAAGEVDCAAPPVTGYGYTSLSPYANGWRDIINSATFSVDQRVPDVAPSVVWSTSATIAIPTGSQVSVTAAASDPFIQAIVPQSGVDFTATGGTVTATLDKTSGQTVTISLTASLADSVVTGLQLQAVTLPVATTVLVSSSDPSSIAQHGEQDYPQDAPWAGVGDAQAIADVVQLRYSQRRPTIQLNIPSTDAAHYLQVLTRTISDLITVENDELGMLADFYVEHVAHALTRMNPAGRPPVHSVTLGCEKAAPSITTQPFTFDVRGAGFDQGAFGAVVPDNPDTVWIWDDPVQGCFDQGLFAT
jgi:hypothetical protein